MQITGAVASFSRHETPHFLAGVERGSYLPPSTETPNQDFGLFVPEVGLLVADGLGGTDGGALASVVVVRGVDYYARDCRLSEMPADEAVDAVREVILPLADVDLMEAKDKAGLVTAATTLGALLLARKHVVAVGIGAPPISLYHQNRQGESRFAPITAEQSQGNEVYNTLSGDGRRSGSTVYEGDQVDAWPLVPGSRYVIPTDGFTGDMLNQRTGNVVDDKGRTFLEAYMAAAESPDELVSRLSLLPYVLESHDFMVPDYDGDGKAWPVYFVPKIDDMTIGALFVDDDGGAARFGRPRAYRVAKAAAQVPRKRAH